MSSTSTFREAKIALKDLKLWSENPRFPRTYSGKPENQLIDYIVSVPHYKIKEFGKEVVEDYDMPVFEKLAIYSGEGSNIAYEGNRRVTVYKLLVNPNLTSDENVREYFFKLKRTINIDEDFTIDCVVSDNKKEVLRYVDRKHLNNNNEVAWGTVENSNAKLRWLDNPDKLDIVRSNLEVIIRNLKIPVEHKDKVLGRGSVTTLFRILNPVTVEKFFSLLLDEDNNLVTDDIRFEDKLEIVINDVLQKKTFNKKIFSRLSAEEIEEYLNSITLNDLPSEKSTVKGHSSQSDKKDTAKGITKSKNKDGKTGKDKTTPITKGKSGAEVPKKKPKVKPKSLQRKRLIPRDCKLSINQDKINNIYHELRIDLVLDDTTKSVPNAVGVLFRVFIEVSLDEYAEKKHGYNFKKETGIPAKIDWVVNKLIAVGYKKSLFKNILIVGSSKAKHSYLSIEKFHQYVHGTTLEPSPSELKSKWNLLESFFEIIWEELNKK